MIMTAVVAVAVLAIGYMWSSRGFLSAFLHLLCVIVAGALALAVWEPIAFFLLNMDNGQSEFAQGLSWGAALGLPFLIILAIVRTIVDKTVPANAPTESIVNMIGGGACGAAAGVLGVGIAVLSIGFTRVPTEFAGYKPLDFDTTGSMVVKSPLVLPVDKWTAQFYGALSKGIFRPVGGDSLARLRPELAWEGPLLRNNFEEGKSRHTVAPTAFEVVKRYTYNPADGKLMSDGLDPKPQSFVNLEGESASAGGSQIEGYVVTFKAGAKERAGNVIVGPSQVRLVVAPDPNRPEETVGVQTLAAISQGANRADLGRWRFDAPNTFFQSVGGGSDATMAFEFIVPKGAVPVALYVKGVRNDVSSMAPAATYASMTERDAAIRNKSIIARGGGGAATAGGKPAGSIDTSGAVTVKLRPEDVTAETPIILSASLPGGLILQKDGLNGLTIAEGNQIDGGGLAKFNTDELKKTGFTDRQLQVRNFIGTDDTVTVQVRVDGRNAQWGFTSNAASGVDRSKPPVLIDATGTVYQAFAYVFRNSDETHVYCNPQAPVNAVTDLPAMSKSRPDAELVLVYRVNTGATVKYFAVGEKAIAKFDPEFKTVRQ